MIALTAISHAVEVHRILSLQVLAGFLCVIVHAVVGRFSGAINPFINSAPVTVERSCGCLVLGFAIRPHPTSSLNAGLKMLSHNHV